MYAQTNTLTGIQPNTSHIYSGDDKRQASILSAVSSADWQSFKSWGVYFNRSIIKFVFISLQNWDILSYEEEEKEHVWGHVNTQKQGITPLNLWFM